MKLIASNNERCRSSAGGKCIMCFETYNFVSLIGRVLLNDMYNGILKNYTSLKSFRRLDCQNMTAYDANVRLSTFFFSTAIYKIIKINDC